MPHGISDCGEVPESLGGQISALHDLAGAPDHEYCLDQLVEEDSENE